MNPHHLLRGCDDLSSDWRDYATPLAKPRQPPGHQIKFGVKSCACSEATGGHVPKLSSRACTMVGAANYHAACQRRVTRVTAVTAGAMALVKRAVGRRDAKGWGIRGETMEWLKCFAEAFRGIKSVCRSCANWRECSEVKRPGS